MSWLGQGFSRESMKSLADAFAEVQEGIDPKGAARQDAAKKKKKVDVFAYDRKIGKKTTPDGKPLPPPPKNEEVEVQEGMKTNVPGAKIGGSIKKPNGKTMKVEQVIEDAYSVSVEDGIALEEGKKKCKDGYEYDSDEKKCVKKKKSSRTTVIIGRGYGGHHHHDDDDKDDNNGGDEGGGDAGGGDGGGGGGE